MIRSLYAIAYRFLSHCQHVYITEYKSNKACQCFQHKPATSFAFLQAAAENPIDIIKAMEQIIPMVITVSTNFLLHLSLILTVTSLGATSTIFMYLISKLHLAVLNNKFWCIEIINNTSFLLVLMYK